MRTALSIVAIALLATPAQAWSGVQIPEPSNLVLFGLGLAGLVIGRQASIRRRNRDDD